MSLFVILCMPRTGSNMIVNMLRTHPDIACLAAIFTPRGWRKGALQKIGQPSDATTPSPLLASEWTDLEYRIDHMDELLALLLSENRAKKLVGFKHHMGLPSRVSTQTIVALALPTIILQRDNILASYSSNKIAKKTGQGALKDRDRLVRTTIDFDADEFVQYKTHREKCQAHWTEQAGLSGAPTMHLDYTEARTVSGMDRVVEFLGQSPGQFGEWGTVKRNSNNIVSRFSNPEAVEAYLEENNLMHWISED